MRSRFALTAALSFLISLAVDLAAGNLTTSISVIGQFVRLTLSYNAGIAFGIALPSPWQEILIACALIAIAIVAVQSTNDRISSIAFGLIIGGAGANLIDRFMNDTVTDFIAVGTFPVFNLADSCITIGAGMLLLEWWSGRKKRV